MRLVILGATGGIGTILVRRATEQGHQVTAYARAPEKIRLTHPNLKVIRGNLFDAQEMAAVFAGHDVVLSAFGPTVLRKTTLRRDFGRAVAAAMRQSGVKRVLVVTSGMLFPDPGLVASLFKHTMLRNVAPDAAAMEQEFVQSDLEWTMVRPQMLTNRSATNSYRLGDGYMPKGGVKIARADVAGFMLRDAAEGKHIRQFVGICY